MDAEADALCIPLSAPFLPDTRSLLWKKPVSLKHSSYIVDFFAYTVDCFAYTVDFFAYTVDFLGYTVDSCGYTVDFFAYTVDSCG
jgi:hypothetical protein